VKKGFLSRKSWVISRRGVLVLRGRMKGKGGDRLTCAGVSRRRGEGWIFACDGGGSERLWRKEPLPFRSRAEAEKSLYFSAEFLEGEKSAPENTSVHLR